MAKPTLLDIVQEILSSMDSDEVNSIDDTFESQQVATIVRSTYQAMLSNRNWPHTKRPIQITSFSDPALPTHLTVQDDIKELIFMNYDIANVDETRKRYSRMRWLEPDEFLRRANNYNTDEDTVDIIIDPSGIEIAIENDRHPQYYTSFDDETLVLDAYDKEVDSTIVSSKIQAHAYVMPVWSSTDTFVPDLPMEAFSALIAEAKSTAHVELKQQDNPKAEQESRRQQAWLSRKAWRVNGGIKYPNYGRRGKYYIRFTQPWDNSSYIDRID